MDLATRLKSTRKRLGLSQSALAKATGVSQPTVANWERGGHVPRRDALDRIASALDTDPAWLLSGEMPAKRNPAHRHLALPIRHVPVYRWPLDATDPLTTQPARYISIAIDKDGVFALDADPELGFPGGTVLMFAKGDTRLPGRFLVRSQERFTLEPRGSLENVFARLIYSVVPH